MHIRTNCVHDHPLINQRLLSDERDLARLTYGFRVLLNFLVHPALARAYKTVHAKGVVIDPQQLSDNDDLDSWLLSHVSDGYHPVGTCRMGSPDDPQTVVDPSCRVKGTEGLWVIDASIMPAIPRANTTLTTLAMAELAAARMLGHIGVPS